MPVSTSRERGQGIFPLSSLPMSMIYSLQVEADNTRRTCLSSGRSSPLASGRRAKANTSAPWSTRARAGDIEISQEDYANEKLELTKLPTGAKNSDFVSESIKKAMRKQYGALAWLAKQTRMDIAVQVTLSQQSFPNPTIGDAKRIRGRATRSGGRGSTRP